MQQVLWIGEWEKRGVAMKAKPVPLDRKPDRVWTLYGWGHAKKPPKLPFLPVHRCGAFLEDSVHDWNWRGGKFYYSSRVADHPVWLLLEYEDA